MDYGESRAYIKDAERYGSVLGLDNMYEMMKRLGNPQDSLKVIHVAGTNGKGSVIAYLYSVLGKAGYRVGRYVSPTLYSYRERLEICGERITCEEFAECVTEISEVIREMTREGLPHPTPFEIETAAAFLYFKKENCDIVLLEVGMGGNLDATNIIKQPVLSIIVSISMDHMGFLGSTLGEIAEKKAGIIKKGCPMITVKQKPEAEAALKERCKKMEVPFVYADSSEAQITEEGIWGQSFWLKGEEYRISLAGVYQKENSVLALKALELLEELGYSTSLKERKEGLLAASWKGRFTVIHKDPLMIVDGAHNPGAADMMAETIRHYFMRKNEGQKLIYIMGMFRDKDCRSVLSKTLPFAQQVFTIQTPDNERALPSGELADIAREFHPDVTACDHISDAVAQAFQAAGPKDVILAFGSLSFIGVLTEAVKQYKTTERGN